MPVLSDGIDLFNLPVWGEEWSDYIFQCDNTPSVSQHINFFKPFRFLAGDELVVPIGVSHISS